MDRHVRCVAMNGYAGSKEACSRSRHEGDVGMEEGMKEK